MNKGSNTLDGFKYFFSVYHFDIGNYCKTGVETFNFLI